MKRNTTIRYAYHEDDGSVISRVGEEVAWPILDWGRIGEGGDFTKPFTYHLEKMSVFSVGHEWDHLVWTKKIDHETKNKHRVFWGMPELKQWWTPGQVYIKNDPQYPMLRANQLAIELSWPTPENTPSLFPSRSTFEGFLATTRGWLESPSTELTLETAIASYWDAVDAMKKNYRHGGHPNDLWFSFRTLGCLMIIAKEKE